MSGSSRRSQVTVTLGRIGRVVKRDGVLSDEDEDFQIGVPIAGRKRSIKDRLSGYSEDNKRQRGESTSNSIDTCLDKDDLRFKLMQKNTEREHQSIESLRSVDLRDKLSRKNSRPSSNIITMRPPESAASIRHPVRDPRTAGMTRHSVLESASVLRRLPLSRNPSELSSIGPPRSYSSLNLENSRRRSPEVLRRRSPEVLRRRSPEVLRRRSPEVLRRRSPEVLRRRSPEVLRRRSPEVLRRRSPEVLRRRSPEVLRRRSPEVVRRRTPERLLPSSGARGLSPQRSGEELQRRPLIKPYDDGRSTSYVGISPTTAVRSSPYIIQSLVPAPPVKSVVPVSHYPQASGNLQTIPSSVDVHPTVDSLLQSLGLDKYAIYFKAEEVDMNALRQLGDSDLKDLGIPMGPRKKILQAVMTRARRQQ